MTDDAADRRAERAARAEQLQSDQRRRREQDSEKAQALIDKFLVEATEAGLEPEELTARPRSGSGRYRTGITGWYLRRDRTVGVGVDGGYYLLSVPPTLLGRWRTAHVEPSPPPLIIGEGGRDGDALALDKALQGLLRPG